MPLSFKPFLELTIDNVLRLQQNSIPEGLRIDYKRELYGPNDNREFLKDVSAFANSHGGYLLIGVSESNGVPTTVDGVSIENIDIEIQRYENLLRDGVEPRIIGVQVRRLDLNAGRTVIAINIPRSLNPPHRVCVQNHNKFYVRNSNGKHEANVEELRQLFGFSSSLRSEMVQFVEQRRAAILSNNDFIRDSEQGRLIVHTINISSFGDQTFLDLKKLDANPYPFIPGSAYRGIEKRITVEGLVIGGLSSPGVYRKRALVFRDGTVELVSSELLGSSEGQATFAAGEATVLLVDAVNKAIRGIRNFGENGPLAIFAALDSQKGAAAVFYPYNHSHPRFDRELLELPPFFLQEFDISKEAAHQIRPLLTSLWNALGILECGYFHGEEWKPPSDIYI